MKHYIIFVLLFISFGLKAQFTAYPNQVLYSWAHPYESYEYGGMQFRLKTPNNFDPSQSEKYPLILFFHGAGEGGTSNEKQLIHGGRNTLNAITSGEFPGLALYPQATGSKWLITQVDQAKAIVDELIANYNVDPNRIYVHGLSGGADGTWRFAYRYPKLVTAMHPMSGVPGYSDPVGVTKFIPTWLAQGGRDNNPRPSDGNNRVTLMRDAGANIRYSYQPNTGHGTWNNQYNKPDFFTWFLDKNKTDITVLYGQSEFCEGDPINITLGITAGFNNYEWAKDNTSTIIASGNGVNTINVTQTGLYYVRFQRGTEWTEWSQPVNVSRNLAPAATPSTEIGNQSLNLPTLSGQQAVRINTGNNAAFYQWLKNALPISGATNSNYTANSAGSYSLSVRPEQETGYEPDGITPSEYRAAPQPCFSDPSDPVVVTTENGLNVPAKPTNFSANVLSDNSIVLNWDDNANNELAFELYRSTQAGTGYILVERILANGSANPHRFIDQPVQANTTYYYRMRAVNNAGGSAYTAEVNTSTAIDSQAPTAPILSLVTTTKNSVDLSWTGAVDNVGIVEYEVYRDNNLIATVSGTTYTNAGLPINTVFNYTVKAKDASDNISVSSNQITARTIDSGLSYSYYHHNNLSVVSQIETEGNLIRTADVDNFNISVRDRDFKFAFVFEGYILIPKAGTYTFYTNSDDGSRLFINGNSIVNNDGTHGCRQRNGQVTLPAGFASIRVSFFENGGGECLEVRWKGPGVPKQLIPDEVLFQDQFVPGDTPNTPSNLQAAQNSVDQIDLTWTDNSTDENNFEIYRSLNQNNGYQVVKLLDPNIEQWSDTGLNGGTPYYYKVKAINLNGASDFEGPVSASTVAYPPAPAIPSNFSLGLVNGNNVLVSWTDNSATEIGFEVYRSTSNAASSFTLIHTADANITSFEDTQTSGNSNYYYRIRAKGNGSFSGYTTIANINTPNTAPTIEPIIDRSVKHGTSLKLLVNADDSDGDPLTFSFNPSLPSFFSFADNGYGQGEFTITPVVADDGVYTIAFSVSDGSGGTDSESFVITVSDNNNPSIDHIPNVDLEEGFTEIVNVSVSDETLPMVVLQASNLPAFITFTDDGSGAGTFEISPQIGDAGNYNNIKLLASDGNGGFSEATFNVNITAVKRNYSVQVNFGGSNSQSPWNDIRSGNGFKGDNLLISNDGLSQDITLNVPSKWFTSTQTSNLSSTLYIPEVVQTYVQKPGGGANFVLQGLNPSLSYDITLFSGTVGNLGNVISIDIDGDVKSQDPDDNISETINFIDITPDSNNEIQVDVSGDDFILNAMVIDVYYDDGQLPLAPSNLSLTALSSSEVEISWQDNSNNEQRFEIYRSKVSETGPYQLVANTLLNQTSYTDTNLESSTLYYYKVRSVNVNGLGETPVGLVTTLNSAPTINAIDDVIMKTGESLNIPITATDNEGDPIIITSSNLPDFVQVTDNGDGTGQLTINPGTDDIGFYEDIVLTAEDNFGNYSTTKFLISVTDASFNNTVFINFGSGSNAIAPWNNVNTLPNLGAEVNNFTNSNGDASNFGVKVGNNWTSVDNTGLPVSYTSNFPYDQDVLKGAWKSDSVEWNGNENVSLTIVGLDPNLIYNFDLIVATNRWKKALADYALQGTSRRINPLSNEENIYHFSALTPNSAGEVELEISRTESSEYIYLNALIIKELDVHNSEPLAPSHLKALGESRSSIDLKWVDNSFNETGFEIYYTDEIGKTFSLLASVGANTEMYSHTGLNTDDHFIYKIRAINGSLASGFSSESAAITLHHQLKININTNQASDLDAPSPWNNTRTIPPSGGSAVFGPLIDDNGQPTPEELRLEQFGTGGANTGGFETGDNSGVYPDNAIQAYYFAETNDIPVIFTLDNLNADFNYGFTFFASEGLNLNPVTFATAISEFTIENETKILLADYNSTETVSIENVSPNTENAISFELTSSAALNSRFGFINAFVVDVYTPTEVAFDNINPSKPQNLQALDVTENSFELIWDVATDNVGMKEYEVYQNGQLIATTAETSLSVTDLSPDYEYIFAVRAIDRNHNKSDFSADLIVNTSPSTATVSTYYSKTSGDLDKTSTWNSEEDGSGSSPADFTSDNQEFILNRNATLASALTISGASTRLVVSDNTDLIIDASFAGAISAMDNAEITLNVDATPEFVEMHASSLVQFNSGTNTIPTAKYGNLSLGGSTGSSKQFNAGNITVEGALTVVDGVNLTAADPNNTSIVAKGAVSFHGIGASASSSQMLSLVMAGSGTQQIKTFNDDIKLFQLHIKQGAAVVIDTDKPNMQLITGNATGGGVVIEDGASLDIGSHQLLVNGKGSINPQNQSGTIKTSKGRLEMHSQSTLTSHLYFESGQDTLSSLVADMVNMGEIAVNSPLYLSEELQVIEGRVDAKGNLTLVSDAIGTAYISEIQNRGKIEGAINAQRYVPAPTSKLYRYYGSMVKNATVADWQNHIAITGTFTGNSSGSGLGSSASVFYYDELQTAKWIAYPSATNQEVMKPGTGYAVYMRDLSNPLTLELSGKAVQGDFNFTLTPGSGDPNANNGEGDGWNLIANPYLSPIEWTTTAAWTGQDVSAIVSVWDADYPGGGKFYYAGAGVNQDSFDGEIAIGQGFWVQAIDSDPQLRISEAAKVNSGNTQFYRTSKPAAPIVAISLTHDGLEDKTFIKYSDEGSKTYDPAIHGMKRENGIFNISSATQDGVSLAINQLPQQFCRDSIAIITSNMTTGNYSLSFEQLDSFQSGELFTLVDHYTGSELHITSKTHYNFEVTSPTGPSALNRFAVIIEKPKIAQDLNVSLSSTTICEGSDQVVVSIEKSQKEVNYDLILNGINQNHQIVGNGNDLSFTINADELEPGKNSISIQAGFENCTTRTLDKVVSIERWGLPEVNPVSSTTICKGSSTIISIDPTEEGLSFRWYSGKFDDTPIFESSETTFETPVLNKSTRYYYAAVNGNGCESKDRESVAILVDSLNTSIELVSLDSELCDGNGQTVVNLLESQEGVTYGILINGEQLSEKVGTGSGISFNVLSTNLNIGQNLVQVQAHSNYCNSKLLTTSLTINVTAIPTTEKVDPVSICAGERASVKVAAKQQNISYRWYSSETSGDFIYESHSAVYETEILYESTSLFYTTVNSNGCESEERQKVVLIVEELEKPIITVEEGLLLSSSKNGNQWFFNGNPIEGETSPSLLPYAMGEYSLSVGNGVCEVFSDPFEYQINASSNRKSLKLTIYPNPSDRDFNIVFNQILNDDAQLKIMDLTGKEVYSQPLTKGKSRHAIYVNELASGTYIIQIMYHKKLSTERLFIN